MRVEQVQHMLFQNARAINSPSIKVGLVAAAALAIFSGPSALSAQIAPPQPANSLSLSSAEGPVSQANIVAGPFNIARKYRSMEGPFVNQDIRVGDLLNSGSVSVDESQVHFTEGDGLKPAMMSKAPAMFNSGPGQSVDDHGIIGLVRRKNAHRELYWFKGIKLEVIDENDQVMPTCEFICHFNLDIDVNRRNELFPYGESTVNPRLISLTQGQTEFYFPRGYGVPVASDEIWRFGFQAANRTSDKSRRVRHRCIVYFIKDSDLQKPLTALQWYVPYAMVVVDRDTEESARKEHERVPSCLASQGGVIAPNRGAQLSLQTDALGRKMSGHWVVPPGTHTYTTPIVEEQAPHFADKDRIIHAAWTHIHPLCTVTRLVQCDGSNRRELYHANVETKTDGGLEIKKIHTVSSEPGILLKSGQHYELEGTYENTTGAPQDSMISHGIFMQDDNFKKPDWVRVTVAEQNSTSQTAKNASEPRSFDSKLDGPLLTKTKYIELNTTAGKLHLSLEPALAPINATYMFNLFCNGAFDSTAVFECKPGFLIQFGAVSYKAPEASAPLKDSLPQVRSLPLEVEAQKSGKALHKQWVLSMARGSDANSAIGSFCIMLTDAPQLDNQYTIFGHVINDDESRATIARIVNKWQEHRPWITSSKEIPPAENSMVQVSLPRFNW